MEKLTLSISQLKNVLNSRLKRQINEPGIKLRSVFIEGERGIGKTDVIKQIANEVANETGKEIKVVTLPAAVLEAPDINGLGYVDEKFNLTRFAAPEFLPSTGFGILFIDEVNRANTDVQNGLLTLVQDRQIHSHKIGDGWLIVGAGNTNSNGGNYKVKEFDPALKDRFAYVSIAPTASDLITYLDTKYPNNYIVSYLQNNFSAISFDSKGGLASPRALEYAIKATLPFHPKTSAYEYKQQLSLELGLNVANDMMEFFETKLSFLTLEDILNDRRKTVKYLNDNKDNPSLVHNSVSILSEEILRRFANETTELHELNMKLDSEEVYLFSKTERENVAAFLSNLTEEHAIGLLTQTAPWPGITFNLEFAFGRHFLINLVTKKKRCKAKFFEHLTAVIKTELTDIEDQLQNVADAQLYESMTPEEENALLS